jgi:hypothetical protein
MKCNFELYPLVFFHDFLNLYYYFSTLRPNSQYVIALFNLLIFNSFNTGHFISTSEKIFFLFSFCLYVFQKLSKNSTIIGLYNASAMDMCLGS